jgi:cobalamin synthase
MVNMRGDESKARKRMRLVKIGAGTMAAMVIMLWLVIVSIELRSGPVSPLFFITLIPLIFIIALLVLVVRRHEKAVKSGMPLTDERSSAIDNKAGRYTVTVMTWFLLASAFYQTFMEELGLPDMELGHFIWVVFFLMMGVFVGFKWYFGRKEL